MSENQTAGAEERTGGSRLLPPEVLERFAGDVDSPTGRRDLFGQVLEARQKLPGALLSDLRRLLQSHVRVPGFSKDPLAAPPSRLLQALANLPRTPKELQVFLMESWAALRADLLDEGLSLLTEPEGADLLQRASDGDSPDDAGQAWDELLGRLQERTGASRPATQLTLYMGVARLKASHTCRCGNRLSEIRIRDTGFSLEQLRTLPLEDPLWEELERFIETAGELLATRREELASRGRQVHEALQKLVSDFPDLVEMFEVPELGSVRFEELQPGDGAARELHLQALRERLETYREVERQHGGTRALAERRELRSRMDALETEIQEAFQALLAWYRPPEKPEPEPPQGPGPAPREERKEDPKASEPAPPAGGNGSPRSALVPEFPVRRGGPRGRPSVAPPFTGSSDSQALPHKPRVPDPEPVKAESAPPSEIPSESAWEEASVRQDELPSQPLDAEDLEPETAGEIPAFELEAADEAPNFEPETATVSPALEPGATDEAPPLEPETAGDEAPSEAATPTGEETDPLEQALAPEDLPSLAPASPVLPEVAAAEQPRTVGSLPALEDLARHTLDQDTPDAWETLVCALLGADDAAGAYWLVRAREASGHASRLPAWLLKAVQGARWLPRRVPGLVEELYELTADHQPEGDFPSQLLGVAAALRLALAEPASAAEGWLHPAELPKALPALSSLLRAALDFTHRGLVLAPHAVYDVQGLHQLEEQTAQASREVARWRDDAPRKALKARRASEVWRQLVDRGGLMREALEAAARDRRDQVAVVLEVARRWSDESYIEQQISRLDRKLGGARNPLTADPLEQLRRETLKTCRMLGEWGRLVEASQNHAKNRDYEVVEIQRLRAGLEQSLPDLAGELTEMWDGHPDPAVRAAALAVGRTVADLCATLSLAFPTSLPPALDVVPAEWLVRAEERLEGALGHRLLWTPEVPVDGRCQPEAGALAVLPRALAASLAEGRSLEGALERALREGDFRFRDAYLASLGEEVAAHWVRRSAELLEASREVLRKEVEEVADQLEQAVVDGYFEDELLPSGSLPPLPGPSDSERDRVRARLQSLDPDRCERFGPARQVLEVLRKELHRQLRDSLEQQRQKWLDLQGRLPAGDPGTQKVRTAVESALDSDDLRVAQELLDHLKESLDSGKPLEIALGGRAARTQVLEEFRRVAPQLDDWLRMHNIGGAVLAFQRRRPIPGANAATLTQERLDEAILGLDAWKRLRTLRPLDAEVPGLVAALMAYLGFLLAPPASRAVKLSEKPGLDWAFLEACMSASELARPIPQFGSQAEGHYPILCVWERLGADTLSARIKELRLEVRNLLVLYLGRMTGRMRRELTRVNRDRGLSVLLLDETLLLFLAGQMESRLPAFLRCAAPHAMLNPYTPNQAGNVPPEMFFGRESLVRDLQRPEGPCLVFGGRQLGKSALLRQAERQFHDPNREQYAFVEDVRVVGQEHGGDLEVLWRRLRDALVRKGFFPSNQGRTSKVDNISKAILEELRDRPRARVLAMFDEADNFLDADSEQDFRVVNELKVLMQESGYRFKVVFAGLHNVQRFQSIPNQPLAHLGRPILIGPLEPRDAFDLVEQPLSVLGFRFRDHAPVLRTLSYTNYHAGLIQLFSRDLVSLLQRRAGDEPPRFVEKQDVEEVYRQLQRDIALRFNWTLALDRRYEALTLILIAEQLAEKSGYSRAYPHSVILRMGRTWWPAGFHSMQTDELRGLLDEMVGLGVLVRNTQGHYRLRSPNIVRLMGTEVDIETRLQELMEAQPVDRLEVDEFRASLSGGPRQHGVLSPLTRAQERLLSPSRSGVGAIFASEALGLEHVEAAVQTMIPPDLGEQGHFQAVPAERARSQGLVPWLRQQVERHPRAERLLFLRRLDRVDPEEILDATDFCDRFRRDRIVRVLYLLPPGAAREWLLLPDSIRSPLEERIGATTWLRRHSANTMRHRLRETDMEGNPEVCGLLARATGGWPSLVELLFARAGKTTDLKPEANRLLKELEQGDLARRFLRTLGLPPESPGWNLLRALAKEGPLEREYLTPELVDLGPGVGAGEFDHWVEFLIRMGCVDEADDQVAVEPLVGRLL